MENFVCNQYGERLTNIKICGRVTKLEAIKNATAKIYLTESLKVGTFLRHSVQLYCVQTKTYTHYRTNGRARHRLGGYFMYINRTHSTVKTPNEYASEYSKVKN